MTNVKISELPNATTPLTGDELVPLVQNNVTRKATVSDFAGLTTIGTMADLYTTPIVDGEELYLSGYYTANDGGGGQFYGVTGALAGTYTDNGGTVIVPAGGNGSSAWLRVLDGNSVTVKQFGAHGDGTTDDHDYFQAAFDWVVSTGNTWEVLIPNGTPGGDTTVLGTYKINSGLTLNTYYVSLEGYALLDFSSLASGAAITVICDVDIDVYNGYARKAHIKGNIRVKGPGANSPYTSTIGFDFNSPTALSNAAVLMENVAVWFFDVGHRHANRGYNSMFVRCEVFECGIGIQAPSGFTDYGEKIVYSGCVIYNNYSIGVSVSNPTFMIVLNSCSLDYNARQVYTTSGGVNLISCHVEGHHSAPMFYSSGTFFLMEGGVITPKAIPGNPSTSYDYAFIDTGSTGQYSNAVFRNVYLSGNAAYKYFAIGNGNVVVDRPFMYYINGQEGNDYYYNPYFVSEQMNTLVNPGFDALNDLFITSGTSITSRTSGGNITLSSNTNATYIRTGTNSLKVAKTGAADSNGAEFVIYFPLNGRNSFGGLGVWMQKPAHSVAAGDRIGFAWKYANLQPSTTLGIPNIVKSDTLDSSRDVTLSAMAAGWTFYGPSVYHYPAPGRATHVVMYVSLYHSPAGDYYFDDAIGSEM